MIERRDRVVQQLSEHFAADRIDVEELERRLDLVYQAASPDELAAITADLPAPSVPAIYANGVARTGPRTRVASRIRSVLSNVERSGPMEVPSYLTVRAILGNVELDLRDAIFGAVTEIAIRAVLGNIEITLPAGVRVENDGGGVLGSFECHVSPGMMPMVGTAPIVRLTGSAFLGNVEVDIEPPTASSTPASADASAPPVQHAIHRD